MSAQKNDKEHSNNNSNKIDDCFIITPIGEVNSEVFRKTTGLINAIINPVLKDFDLRAVPAHEVTLTGSIPKQIIKHIYEDKLVIANLTGLNANVMYELAVRHAVKLPVIMMAEYGTKLPFDVSDQRTVFYYDTLDGVEDCKPRLKSMIETSLSTDATIDNPIYDVIKETSVLKSSDTNSAEAYLISKLDRIESMINLSTKNNYIMDQKQVRLLQNPIFIFEHNENLLKNVDIFPYIQSRLIPIGVHNIGFHRVDDKKFIIKINNISREQYDEVTQILISDKSLKFISASA